MLVVTFLCCLLLGLSDLPSGESFNLRQTSLFKRFQSTSLHSLVSGEMDAPIGDDAVHVPLRVIVSGAPASGKGTQCEAIRERYGLVHLSTGEILRAAVKANNELGSKVKAYLDAGQLVPDELITGIVCDRLQQKDCKTSGWLLDGFPRTKSQALALAQSGLNPDCFLLLHVSEDVLVDRVTGRRIDPVTGRVYHLKYSPPDTPEVAARLVQRSDDTPDKIKYRYKQFRENVDDLYDCYKDNSWAINATGTPEQVRRRVFAKLDKIESLKISKKLGSKIVSAPKSISNRLNSRAESKSVRSRSIKKNGMAARETESKGIFAAIKGVYSRLTAGHKKERKIEKVGDDNQTPLSRMSDVSFKQTKDNLNKIFDRILASQGHPQTIKKGSEMNHNNQSAANFSCNDACRSRRENITHSFSEFLAEVEPLMISAHVENRDVKIKRCILKFVLEMDKYMFHLASETASGRLRFPHRSLRNQSDADSSAVFGHGGFPTGFNNSGAHFPQQLSALLAQQEASGVPILFAFGEPPTPEMLDFINEILRMQQEQFPAGGSMRRKVLIRRPGSGSDTDVPPGLGPLAGLGGGDLLRTTPKDPKQSFVDTVQSKAAALNLTAFPVVQSALKEELEKFASLETNNPEYHVSRNFLDWLTSIPWGKYNAQNVDISSARQILDADHYGMKDVKERILEFMAVQKLRQGVPGKIICLAGPPGVGKTSIARSIARALNRTYYHFSVGGLTDVSEIRGHRRTYVGSMPGKLVQALKKVDSMNPLILIDEIDKVGANNGFRGDPSAALLEVLDPEQNSGFMDHYLDVPLDLSKVLFICTANSKSSIPPPLLDRMEVIDLTGYVAEEKMEIARRYLMPTSQRENGLAANGEDIFITNDAIAKLVQQYCRESGVRNLKNHIDKIYRKAALKLVEENEKNIENSNRPLTPVSDPAGAATVVNLPTPETVSSTTGQKYCDDSAIVETCAVSNVHRRQQPYLLDQYATDVVTKSQQNGHCAVCIAEAKTQPIVAVGNGNTAGTALAAVHQEKGTAEKNSGSPRLTISSENLKDYVGGPTFLTDRIYGGDTLPVGVSTALAYTSMGGSILFIETIVTRPIDTNVPLPQKSEANSSIIASEAIAQLPAQNRPGQPTTGTASLMMTGNLGDTIKESTQIAYSFAKSFMSTYYPENTFFERASIHLHLPEGATPKDGPSAGCAMATALISQALGRPISASVAMTGELTLMGRVLRIGGVKEKTMAAKRENISTLIFPTTCKSDWDELEIYIKDGIKVHFVDKYEEIAKLLGLL